MKFVLNEGLTETSGRSVWNPQEPFERIRRDLETDVLGNNWQAHQSHTVKVLRAPDLTGVETVQTGYLYVLSRAHSDHIKVTLHPHDVWYLLLAEMADIVAKNVEACRPIFTRSPEKIVIEVPTDDVTTIDLYAVQQKLVDLIPVDLSTFLPEFSTMTESARYACLAAFCDSASHYYEYMTFCCGIPQIDIQGTAEDWARVQSHAMAIEKLLNGVGLSGISPWILRVCRAVDNILHALSTGSPERLLDIFSMSRIGSGSQFKIDGWFADFYRQELRGRQLESFPTSFCRVPYTNLETGRKFVGLHGCFLTRREADGFISGDYGELILEKVAKESPKGAQPPIFQQEIVVTKQTVEATSRKLEATWSLDMSETPPADPPVRPRLNISQEDQAFYYAPYVPLSATKE